MRFLLIGILYLSVLNNSSVKAQGVTSCGFKIPPKSLIKSKFQSVYEAGSIVKGMLDSIRWQENFRLQEQNGINNAYATIIRNTRWIVYDNDFLENLDTYAATKWASISVLAHEMGHHYYNHVVTGTGGMVAVAGREARIERPIVGPNDVATRLGAAVRVGPRPQQHTRRLDEVVRRVARG